MSIAENIKHYCDEFKKDIVIECEDLTNDVEQDWDNETTTYTFSDNSCIVMCGSQILAYASKN